MASGQQRPADTGGGHGPQHAGEGADDELLRRVRFAQFGVAGEALHREDDRDALGPAGEDRNGDCGPFQETDDPAAAERAVVGFRPASGWRRANRKAANTIGAPPVAAAVTART